MPVKTARAPRLSAISPPVPAWRVMLAFLAMALVIFTPISAQAQEEAEKTEDMGRWKLTAERVEASNKAGIVVAHGDATLTQGKNFLNADEARYYVSTGWVYLEGDIHARWGDYELWAQEAEFNLKTQTGTIKNGTLFAGKDHIYLTGEVLRKDSDDSYSFVNATITACDGDVPAWSVKAEEGDLTIEGYAEAWDAQFDISDFPVLYSPWVAVPVNTKRKSGLLFPGFGSSSRLGFFYQQPIYLVIDEESDLTLYADYYTRRGPLGGLEYRSTDDLRTKGVWQADLVYDRVTADTIDELDDQFQDEGLVRPNNLRYWVRSKYNGWILNPDIEAKLDLDYVSDSTYLREFDVGHTNYDRVRDMLVDEFGRGMDVVDSTTRESSGLITRSFEGRYAANAKVVWTENLEYMNDNRPSSLNPTVQRLPELSAFAYKQWLPGTPLEWQGSGELTYFYRDYGTQGGRLALHPSLSLPLAGDYGSLIATAGWRQNIYGLDRIQNLDDGASDDNFQANGVPDLGIKAFSEVFRVFDLGDSDLTMSAENAGNSSWVKLKHAIQPRVEYLYVPDMGQDELPEFDDADRLRPTSELVYSLTNIVDRKRATVALTQGEDGQAEPTLSFDYREFFRFRLEQGYDFREAERTDSLGEFPRRPFSDIMGEIIIRPEDYIRLHSRTFYSPYENKITRHEHMLELMDDRLGEIYLGLDFLNDIEEYNRKQDERQDMFRVGGKVYLPWDLTFRADYQYDFVNDEAVETNLRLTYTHQCYDFTLAFKNTPFDTSIGFWFTIMGFDTPHVAF